MDIFIRNFPWEGWYADKFNTANPDWRDIPNPYAGKNEFGNADWVSKNPVFFPTTEDAIAYVNNFSAEKCNFTVVEFQKPRENLPVKP